MLCGDRRTQQVSSMSDSVIHLPSLFFFPRSAFRTPSATSTRNHSKGRGGKATPAQRGATYTCVRMPAAHLHLPSPSRPASSHQRRSVHTPSIIFIGTGSVARIYQCGSERSVLSRLAIFSILFSLPFNACGLWISIFSPFFVVCLSPSLCPPFSFFILNFHCTCTYLPTSHPS